MDIKETSLVPVFIEMVKELKAPVVFELGTKQSISGRPTMHKEWVPHAADLIGIDFKGGADVDYAADAQFLSRDLSRFPRQKCDVSISCSTLRMSCRL